MPDVADSVSPLQSGRGFTRGHSEGLGLARGLRVSQEEQSQGIGLFRNIFRMMFPSFDIPSLVSFVFHVSSVNDC